MFMQSCATLFIVYMTITGVFEAIRLSLKVDDDYVALFYGILGFAFGWVIYPIYLISHFMKMNEDN